MGESPAPLRSGDPAAVGSYRLRGVLGVGGMGTVYLAVRADGREVALKVINPALAGDPAFRHRFAAEARAASRVAGFCTARVLDVDLDGPVPHLVTEYVPGPSLHDYATRHGPLAGQVESVAVGVAAALTAIHAVGLVHADLSPRNVLLSPFGPKVIDFGVARLRGHTAAAGPRFGTPGWLAPEQVAGAPPSEASDVYAWGLLVAWAGTGRLPSGAADLDGLDPGLATVVRRALRPDPRSRPGAEQVLLALVGQDDPGGTRVRATVAPMRGRAPVRAPRTRPLSVPLPPPPPPPRRRPRRAARAAGTVLALVALAACLVVGWRYAETAGRGGTEAGAQPPSPARSPAPSPKPSPVAVDGKLRFTLAKFSCGTDPLGQWPIAKQPNGQFCLAELKVENTSQAKARMWIGSQHLRDSDGNDYAPDEWSLLYYDRSRALAGEIGPGETVEGTLVFDVPAGRRYTELRVKSGLIGGESQGIKIR